MTTPLSPWSVRAVNLPEHADNPVHTAAGGRAAGYDGAVVAGTTIYAYLTRPAAAAWGTEWVTRGAATVRFQAAVLADEHVDLEPSFVDGGWRVTARTGSRPNRRTCATSTVGRRSEPAVAPVGDRLEPLVVELGDRWSGYAARAGEDLALYTRETLVHPAVWPSLANRVFATQLVDGPWVHTRSGIRHFSGAQPGDVALVEAFLVDRFDSRAGERAVVDVRIGVDGRLVAAVEHEAIVRLT